MIRPAALGDTLMLLPSLVQLKGRNEVTLAGREPGLYFLSHHVKKTVDYERGGWHLLHTGGPAPDFIGSAPAVDLAIAFLNDQDGAIRRNLKALLPSAAVRVFPGFPRKDEDIHVAFYLAKCLEACGCPLDPQKAFEEAIQRPLLGGDASPEAPKEIVFHPGSGGVAKNHPTDFWITLLQTFRYRTPSNALPSVILLGPAEEAYRSFYRQRLMDDQTEIVFSPEKNALMPLLRSAAMYIGHDSGITHLAAMLGTPTIALFKNSNVRQWRPLGPRVEVIGEGEGSLSLIEEVWRVAQALLGNNPGA